MLYRTKTVTLKLYLVDTLALGLLPILPLYGFLEIVYRDILYYIYYYIFHNSNGGSR